MEVPRLGVTLELQLLACTTMWNPSQVFDLHHSSRQHWILNPLSEVKDRTCILMDSSQILILLSCNGNASNVNLPVHLLGSWRGLRFSISNQFPPSHPRWYRCCWSPHPPEWQHLGRPFPLSPLSSNHGSHLPGKTDGSNAGPLAPDVEAQTHLAPDSSLISAAPLWGSPSPKANPSLGPWLLGHSPPSPLLSHPPLSRIVPPAQALACPSSLHICTRILRCPLTQ